MSLNVPKRSLKANSSTNPSSSCHTQDRLTCWSPETNVLGSVLVMVNVSVNAEHEPSAKVVSRPCAGSTVSVPVTDNGCKTPSILNVELPSRSVNSYGSAGPDGTKAALSVAVPAGSPSSGSTSSTVPEPPVLLRVIWLAPETSTGSLEAPPPQMARSVNEPNASLVSEYRKSRRLPAVTSSQKMPTRVSLSRVSDPASTPAGNATASSAAPASTTRIGRMVDPPPRAGITTAASHCPSGRRIMRLDRTFG